MAGKPYSDGRTPAVTLCYDSATNCLGTMTQGFTYDGLNRLNGFTETGTGTIGVTHSYDNFGNMLMSSSTLTLPADRPTAYNDKNQITGKVYDAAGNQNVIAWRVEFLPRWRRRIGGPLRCDKFPT